MRHFWKNEDAWGTLNGSSHFMGRGAGGPWGRDGKSRGGDGSGGGPGSRGGPRGPLGGRGEHIMQRILGHGDLRFVILALLEEKPSHGYELIKEIGDKSSGQYTPSPGVIYPTLTFLQEGGFATVTSTDSKNLYTITEEGRMMLAENKAVIDAIFQRMAFVGEKMSRLQEWFGKDEMDSKGRGHHEEGGEDKIRKAMHELRVAMHGVMPVAKENQEAVVEIIGRAVAELKKLVK